ncbi:MAG: hypothetical protein MJE77_03650 [Proteobacteria bacterium]|nr:hypothetical protein [Pseudomonadota bacterium]
MKLGDLGHGAGDREISSWTIGTCKKQREQLVCPRSRSTEKSEFRGAQTCPGESMTWPRRAAIDRRCGGLSEFPLLSRAVTETEQKS